MHIVAINAIPVRYAGPMNKPLFSYYLATLLFLVLDYVFGTNVRIAFLETLPAARLAYYGVCLFCLALMIWRPAWTVFIATFESLVTMIALIISMSMRTLLVTDQMLETGAGVVTVEEIINFVISGGVAYYAWVRGLRGIVGAKRR